MRRRCTRRASNGDGDGGGSGSDRCVRKAGAITVRSLFTVVVCVVVVFAAVVCADADVDAVVDQNTEDVADAGFVSFSVDDDGNDDDGDDGDDDDDGDDGDGDGDDDDSDGVNSDSNDVGVGVGMFDHDDADADAAAEDFDVTAGAPQWPVRHCSLAALATHFESALRRAGRFNASFTPATPFPRHHFDERSPEHVLKAYQDAEIAANSNNNGDNNDNGGGNGGGNGDGNSGGGGGDVVFGRSRIDVFGVGFAHSGSTSLRALLTEAPGVDDDADAARVGNAHMNTVGPSGARNERFFLADKYGRAFDRHGDKDTDKDTASTTTRTTTTTETTTTWAAFNAAFRRGGGDGSENDGDGDDDADGDGVSNVGDGDDDGDGDGGDASVVSVSPSLAAAPHAPVIVRGLYPRAAAVLLIRDPVDRSYNAFGRCCECCRRRRRRRFRRLS
jgi:hypothetical protein